MTIEKEQNTAAPAGAASELSAGLERRIESLEVALRQLLAAAMPVRADGATLQEVARAIPELYDACHSAAIVLRSNVKLTGGRDHD